MSGSISAASISATGPWRSGQPANPPFGHWRLSSRLELSPLPSAVPCARLHAKNIFKEWNLAHVADDAELIVSELTTNAVKATISQKDTRPIAVHLMASHEYLLVQVWDALTAEPTPRPHAIDAEAGRGLEIVSLLGDRWGYCHPADGGTAVWAALVIGAAPEAAPSGIAVAEQR
jgi:anti-sigma regulatory factor (Ser/Thr protein kinase)